MVEDVRGLSHRSHSTASDEEAITMRINSAMRMMSELSMAGARRGCAALVVAHSASAAALSQPLDTAKSTGAAFQERPSRRDESPASKASSSKDVVRRWQSFHLKVVSTVPELNNSR